MQECTLALEPGSAMGTLTTNPRISPRLIANETSPLLRLPAELRNRIYHAFLVSQNETFHLEEGHIEHPALQVCKQIRSECMGIFYNHAIFHFSDPELCIRRLTTLPQNIADLIPELRYDTSEACVKASSWRTAFRELPGLDEDTKLEALSEELRKRGAVLRTGVLKARLVIGTSVCWTSDPLTAALQAVKQGKMRVSLKSCQDHWLI